MLDDQDSVKTIDNIKDERLLKKIKEEQLIQKIRNENDFQKKETSTSFVNQKDLDSTNESHEASSKDIGNQYFHD